MEFAEIKNEDSLRRWLKDRPSDDAIQIAIRCALRVFPELVREPPQYWASKDDLIAMSVLGLLFTSAVVRKHPTREVMDASARALASHYAASSRLASSSARSAFNAAHAGFAYPRNADTKDAFIAATTLATDSAARSAVFASRAAHGYNGASYIWEQVREDARMIEKGQDTMASRLWSIPPPTWFQEIDRIIRASWATDPPGAWDFWLRWWDGVLAGTPLNWELQRAIALELTEEDWEAGPARLAARIAAIEARYVIAATPNGERVEVNPATGRLRLVPVTDLPPDIAEYARRKIIKAVDLFGVAAENQHRALSPDHEMLRSAVADAGNLPVELFDACASASRRLSVRIRNGECPSTETDAVIADYLTRIREVGADILSHDAKTQEVITARNAVIGNEALIDDAVVIHNAVALIVPATEGVLATALPRDAGLATDPMADADDRKEASIRLSSRLLRAGKVIILLGGGTGAAIVGSKEVLEAIPDIVKILDSPFYQQTQQLILRYLGY